MGINNDRSNGNTESIAPLKGLNRQSDSTKGQSPEYPTLPSFKRNLAHYRSEQAVNTNQFIDMGDYGASHYDKKIQNTGQLQNLQDARGNLQPWTHQFANGILKGGVLAGTTFLSGTAGMISGLLNVGTVNPTTASAGDYLNAYINNPVDLWLNDLNNKMESILPNYETYAEQNTPWYQRLGTANFISNDFLKNTGFMIGAMYSGAVWAKGLSAISKIDKLRKAFEGVSIVTKDGETLNEAAKVYRAFLTGDVLADSEKGTQYLIGQAQKLRTAELGLKMKSGFLAAQGEAKLEAIQNTQDWLKLEGQKIDDNTAKIKESTLNSILMDSTKDNPLYTMSYDPNTGKEMPLLTKAGQEEYKKRLTAVEQQGIVAKAEAAKKGQTMSNTIFLMNLPLLTAQDAWVYGRFMAGGFKSASMFEKMAARVNPKVGIKEAITNTVNTGEDVYKANKWLIAGKIAKAAAVPLSEGNEEMMQQSFATGAGNKASAAMNEFYGYRMDKDAEEKAASTFNSFLQGVKQTYSDPEQWEQFAAGAVMSLLGIPSISRTRVTDSKGDTVYDEKGNPTYTKPHLKLNTEFYNAIHEAKEIKRGQQDIVNAINARLKTPEFINLWQSYIRHNKLELDKVANVEANDMYEYKNTDLKQLLSDVESFQKAGKLNDLRELLDDAGNVTEKDIEQIKEDATNKETGKSAYDGLQNSEILNSYKSHVDEVKDFVNKFADIQESIYGMYGRDIDDDTREAMSWQLMTINDVEARTKQLSDETLPAIKKIINVANETGLNKNNSISPESINLYNIANTHSRFSESFVYKLLHRMSSVTDYFVTPEKLKEGVKQFKQLRDEIIKEEVQNRTLEEVGSNTIEGLDKFKKGTPKKDIEKENLEGISPDIRNELDYLNMRILVNQSAINNSIGSEDINSIQKNLNDLLRLTSRRYEFLSQYHKLSAHPELFSKIVQADIKKRIEVHNDEVVEGIFSDMEKTQNNDELTKAYSKIENNAQLEKLNSRIDKSNNESLKTWKKDYNRKNSVAAELIRAIEELPLEKDTIKQIEEVVSEAITEAGFKESSYHDFIERLTHLIIDSNLHNEIKLVLLKTLGSTTSALENTSTPEEAKRPEEKQEEKQESSKEESKESTEHKEEIKKEYNNILKTINEAIKSKLYNYYDKNGIDKKKLKEAHNTITKTIISRVAKIAKELSPNELKEIVSKLAGKAMMNDKEHFIKNLILNYKEVTSPQSSTSSALPEVPLTPSTPTPLSTSPVPSGPSLVVDEDKARLDKLSADAAEQDERDNFFTDPEKSNASTVVEAAQKLANPEQEILVPSSQTGIYDDSGKTVDTSAIDGSKTPLEASNKKTDVEVNLTQEEKDSLLGVAVTQYEIRQAYSGKMVKQEVVGGQIGIQNFLISSGAYSFLKYGGLNAVKDKNGKIQVYLGTMQHQKEDTALSVTNGKTSAYSTALFVEIPESLKKSLYDKDDSVFNSQNLYVINGKYYQVVGVLGNAHHEDDNKYDYVYGYYIKGSYSNNSNEYSVLHRIDKEKKDGSVDKYKAKRVGDNDDNTVYFYQNTDNSLANTYVTEGTIRAGVAEYNDEKTNKDVSTPLREYTKSHPGTSYGFAIRTDTRILYATRANRASINLPTSIDTSGTVYFIAKGNDGKFYPYILKVEKLGENNAAYDYIKNKLSNVFSLTNIDDNDIKNVKAAIAHHLSIKSEAVSAVKDADGKIKVILNMGTSKDPVYKDFTDIDSLMKELSTLYCHISISNCQASRFVDNSDGKDNWFDILFDSGNITTIFSSFNRENSSFHIDPPAFVGVSEQGRFRDKTIPIVKQNPDESKPTSLGTAISSVTVSSQSGINNYTISKYNTGYKISYKALSAETGAIISKDEFDTTVNNSGFVKALTSVLDNLNSVKELKSIDDITLSSGNKGYSCIIIKTVNNRIYSIIYNEDGVSESYTDSQEDITLLRNRVAILSENNERVSNDLNKLLGPRIETETITPVTNPASGNTFTGKAISSDGTTSIDVNDLFNSLEASPNDISNSTSSSSEIDEETKDIESNCGH